MRGIGARLAAYDTTWEGKRVANEQMPRVGYADGASRDS
jgi:hypothetical protein